MTTYDKIPGYMMAFYISKQKLEFPNVIAPIKGPPPLFLINTRAIININMVYKKTTDTRKLQKYLLLKLICFHLVLFQDSSSC